MRPKPICYPWIGQPPFTVERVDQLRAEGLVEPRYQEPPVNPDGSMIVGVAYPMYGVDELGNYLPQYEAGPCLTPKGVAGLGLCEGLRVDIVNREYRCAKCQTMQKPTSYLVWISDAMLYGRVPRDQIAAECKQWHRHGSGVCVSCAPKGDRKVTRSESLPTPQRSGLWKRLWDSLIFGA